MTFELVQHNHWNLSDINELIPYERDIYWKMLVDHKKKLAREQQQGHG